MYIISFPIRKLKGNIHHEICHHLYTRSTCILLFRYSIRISNVLYLKHLLINFIYTPIFKFYSNLSVYYLTATLGLTAKNAATKCTSFGKDWKVSRNTMGASICTKGDTSPYDNCHGCDSWRILVWKDGACDRLLPKDCRFNTTTVAGNYYCGYEPCQDGHLSAGASWS